MLSSYYSTSPDEGSETSIQSSCAANLQPYWSNMEMNPWMTSNMDPSMLGAGMTSDGQYNTMNNNNSNNAWGQPIPTSAPDQGWANPYDYASVNNHNNHHHIQTSRDTSPNEDYFGAVDYSSQDPSQASWDPNDQPMFSPYSEVPPQIGGLGNSANMSISPMNPPQHPYSMSSVQIPSATTITSSSLSNSLPNTPTTSKTSKSKSPKTSTASTTSKSKSSSTTTTSSSKRKASSSSSTTSKQTRELNKMHLPQEVHRIASEHISREAWRICKAEAIEMEQRRVQLLQNGSGKLEREMLEQRQHLSMIRQGVMREQGVLEDALRRAERLGSERA